MFPGDNTALPAFNIWDKLFYFQIRLYEFASIQPHRAIWAGKDLGGFYCSLVHKAEPTLNSHHVVQGLVGS